MDASEQLHLWLKAMDVMQDFVLITKSDYDAAAGGRPIVYANPALCKRTGYTQEELLGRTPSIFQGEDTEQEELNRISDALAKGEKVQAELNNYTRSGELYRIQFKIVPVTDEQGQLTHFVSVQHDVTVERDKERRLKALNNKLQLLSERLPGFVYIMEMTAKGQFYFEFFTDDIKSVYGMSADSEICFENLMAMVHPDDLDMLSARIKESAEQLKSWKTEYRIVTETTGEIRWMRENSQPYRQADGSIKWYGLIEDITDSRLLRDEVERREREFQAVLSTIPEVLFDLDDNGNIRQVFTSSEVLFEQELDAFCGQTLDAVMPVISRKRLFDGLRYHPIGEAEFRLPEWLGKQSSRGDRHYVARIAAKTCNGDGPLSRGYVCSLTDITDRVTAQNQAEWNAAHDMLTGLFNRQGLDAALGSFFQRLSPEHQVAVLVLDHDRFNALNQLFGYQVGDSVLVETARRLVFWIDGEGLVARIGGDQFMIVTSFESDDGDSSRAALALASSLHKTVSAPIELDQTRHHIDISIGVAFSDNPLDTKNRLIEFAELALYEAQHSGGGTVSVFNYTSHEQIRHRQRLFQDLKTTLNQDSEALQLAFQPICCEDNVVGFEVLLRWSHPELGWISPAEFIPIAERGTLMAELGQWVMQRALQVLATWATDERSCKWALSVNLSAWQIHQDGFVPELLRNIQSAAIDPRKLKLEITETLAQFDLAKSVEKLKNLRAIGVQVALDDFGTGYSSLSHLHQLPLDEIKLDQKFVHEMSGPDSESTIPKMVMSLGEALGLRVVAEGVETVEQLRMLRGLGYRFFQGYLLGKPDLKNPLERL